MTEKIMRFYDGKTIFLTGTSGFVGKFILEILLRCFPGVKRIYILLRPKNGVKPQERKHLIFESKVLSLIRMNQPELLEKVEAVSGDASEVNAGISDEDMQKIVEEVDIFFHVAAAVVFTKPYRQASIINSKGVFNTLQLCKKMKNLKAFVYTGTLFSNVHKFPEKIEEKIYELPISLDRIFNEMENGTDESFEKLLRSMNYKWPNSYTFSKCLAESIIKKYAENLPVVIVRPSVIIEPCKGPYQGYLVSGFGFQNIIFGITRGIIRLLPGPSYNDLDVIPVDVVANTHLIAAWGLATGKISQLTVINCSSYGSSLMCNMGKLVNQAVELSYQYKPIPKALEEATARCVDNRVLYAVLQFYQEYIPSVVLDIGRRISGKETKFVKMQERVYYMMQDLRYFFRTPFVFSSDNFGNLPKLLDREDREILYTDIKGITFREILNKAPQISPLFDYKTDSLSPKKRRHIIFKRTMVNNFIRRLSLMITIFLVYLIFKKLFLTSNAIL